MSASLRHRWGRFGTRVALCALPLLVGCVSAIPITPFRSDAELRRYVEEARAPSSPPSAGPEFSPPPACGSELPRGSLFAAGRYLIAVVGRDAFAISRSTLAVTGQMVLPTAYDSPKPYFRDGQLFIVSENIESMGPLVPLRRHTRITHVTLLDSGEFRDQSHLSIRGSLESVRMNGGTLQLHVVTRLSSPHADHPGDGASTHYPVADPSDIYYRGPPRAEPWLNAFVEVSVDGHELTAHGRGIVVARGSMRGGEITERALYVRAHTPSGWNLLYRVPGDRREPLGAVATVDGALPDGSFRERGSHLEIAQQQASREDDVLARIPTARFTPTPTGVRLEEVIHRSLGRRLTAHPAEVQAHRVARARLSPRMLLPPIGDRPPRRSVAIDGPPPFPPELARYDDTPNEIAPDHPVLGILSSSGLQGYLGFSTDDGVSVFRVDRNPGVFDRSGRRRLDQSYWRPQTSNWPTTSVYPLTLAPPWEAIYPVAVVVLTDRSAAAGYLFVEVDSEIGRSVGFIRSSGRALVGVHCLSYRTPSEPVFIEDLAFVLLDGELIEIRLIPGHRVVEVRRVSLPSAALPPDTSTLP